MKLPSLLLISSLLTGAASAAAAGTVTGWGANAWGVLDIPLNGAEAMLQCVAPPPSTNVWATCVVPDNPIQFATFDASLLLPGTNVVAVEVHQASPVSADLSFAFQLAGVLAVAPAPVITLADALDAPGATWNVVGVPWLGQTNVTADGQDAACVQVGCTPEAVMETTVTSPGTVAFQWKILEPVSGMGTFAFGAKKDGEWIFLASRPTYTGNWNQERVDIPTGNITLHWGFSAACDEINVVTGYLDQVILAVPGHEAAPVFVKHPESKLSAPGHCVTFEVEALGYPPPAYRWLFNGHPLSSVTTASLTVNVQTNHFGEYAAVAVNAHGAMTSQVARLAPFPTTLEQALDTTGLVWRTGTGCAGDPGEPWSGQTNITHDGQDGAVGRGFGCDPAAWLETTVIGPGVLSFWWKTFTTPEWHENNDFQFFVMNTSNGWDTFVGLEGNSDWRFETLAVGAGVKRLRWEAHGYCNGHDEWTTSWLDQVSFRTTAEPVIVSIVAAEGIATEQPPEWPNFNAAVFTLERRDTNGQPVTTGPLSVFYQPSGSASNGVDYSGLLGLVPFEEGASRASIVVIPLDDRLAEGTEIVTLTLVPSPPSLLPNWYIPGEPRAATAYILDDETPPPVVTIVATDAGGEVHPMLPAIDSAQFEIRRVGELGHPIDLHYAVGGTASNGVDYARLSGQIVLAPGASNTLFEVVPLDDPLVEETETVVINLLPPALGTPGGLFTLGEPCVATGEIHDDEPPAAFVRRQISRSDVELIATPPIHVSVYAVEDQMYPPAVIANVSHGGVFDGWTGKVKFGPFYDHEPRTLSYAVLIPPECIDVACGAFTFTGTASADGVNTPITGDALLLVAGIHPADRTPADNYLTIAEITAYGAAWRRGETWPMPPVPIPIDYVTRAAFLWRGGECYEVDKTVTNAPLWWVNCGAPGSMEFQPAASHVSTLPAARRQMPGAYVPGEPLDITLFILPAGARAYAVEETVPAGWTVTNISDGGEWDVVNSRVKWGPFLDNVPRAISYQASARPTANGVVRLVGIASFDGTSQSTAGPRQLAESCRVAVAPSAYPGQFQFTLSGRPRVRLLIEASSDLVNWTALGEVTTGAAPVSFVESGAAQFPQRFYRAREER